MLSMIFNLYKNKRKHNFTEQNYLYNIFKTIFRLIVLIIVHIGMIKSLLESIVLFDDGKLFFIYTFSRPILKKNRVLTFE